LNYGASDKIARRTYLTSIIPTFLNAWQNETMSRQSLPL